MKFYAPGGIGLGHNGTGSSRSAAHPFRNLRQTSHSSLGGNHEDVFPLRYLHYWIAVARRIVGLGSEVVHDPPAASLGMRYRALHRWIGESERTCETVRAASGRPCRLGRKPGTRASRSTAGTAPPRIVCRRKLKRSRTKRNKDRTRVGMSLDSWSPLP